MNKLTLTALVLCAIPVSALWEGAPPAKVGVADSGVAYLLQPAAFEMDDLDVRDAQNRPISSPSARRELLQIFKENLVQMLVVDLPHAAARTQAYVKYISHLFDNLFFSRIVDVVSAVEAAILSTKRRFVHIVDMLWISLKTYTALSTDLTSFAPRPSPAQLISMRC